MKQLDKDTIADLTKKKYDFDAIGAAVVAHTQDRSSFSNIFLDIFYADNGALYEYVIMQFSGGGFEARIANMNSLNSDIQEMAKMLNGGCYNECDDYTRLKKGSTKF